MEDNRRVPSRASSDAAERFLANWYARVYPAHVRSSGDALALRRLREVRAEYLSEWSLARKVEDYKRWTLANGRVPMSRSSDPAEKSFYCFWAEVGHGNPSKLSAFAAQAREDLIAFRASQPKRRPARNRTCSLVQARRVSDFHAAHGRLPVFGVEGEKLAYDSMRQLRNAARSGTISPEALEAASQVPGVFEAVRRNPRTELEKLRTWCRLSGRLPRHTIRGRALSAQDEMEQSLGRWMYRHVNRRPGAAETNETQAIRSAILEIREAYPGVVEYRRGVRQSGDSLRPAA